MGRMEAELNYYRAMLCAATSTNNTRNPNFFVISYPSSDHRPAADGNSLAAGKGEMGGYNTMSFYAAHDKCAIPFLATPLLADRYQRAGSYHSSSTDTYLPAIESPLESFSTRSEPRISPQGQTPDTSSRASYLQFNIEEPVAVTEDGLY
jgi:hypothetical protein